MQANTAALGTQISSEVKKMAEGLERTAKKLEEVNTTLHTVLGVKLDDVSKKLDTQLASLGDKLDLVVVNLQLAVGGLNTVTTELHQMNHKFDGLSTDVQGLYGKLDGLAEQVKRTADETAALREDIRAELPAHLNTMERGLHEKMDANFSMILNRLGGP